MAIPGASGHLRPEARVTTVGIPGFSPGYREMAKVAKSAKMAKKWQKPPKVVALSVTDRCSLSEVFATYVFCQFTDRCSAGLRAKFRASGPKKGSESPCLELGKNKKPQKPPKNHLFRVIPGYPPTSGTPEGCLF